MAVIAAEESEELLATLLAYERVFTACWPSLHPNLAQRRVKWGTASATTLRRELAGLIDETDASPLAVRVFWKLLPDFKFRGVNMNCVKDGGLSSIEEMIGLTDYSPQLPWNRQAPHYRKDDKFVVEHNAEKLNILERQDQTEGTTFLRTAKVPMVTTSGTIIGLLGGYQTIDAATAKKLQKGEKT
jgi:hypothetical protein